MPTRVLYSRTKPFTAMQLKKTKQIHYCRRVSMKTCVQEIFCVQGVYDSTGYLWFASKKGLIKYNVATGANMLYPLDDRHNTTGGLSDVNIDKYRRALVCSYYGGVCIFDIAKEKFRYIDVADGIADPKCGHIIVQDSVAIINFSGGLLSLDLKTEQLHILLADDDFHMSGQSVELNGEVITPLRNMFAYFTSGSIKARALPTAPTIQRITFNKTSFFFPDTALSVTHDLNTVSIHYTAFDFADPDHVVFRYMLQGLDTGWTCAQEKRDVNYIHLPPGKYTFAIQSGNGNGHWNAETKKLSFEIVPAFWQTTWFSVLVLVAFIAAVTGFFDLAYQQH